MPERAAVRNRSMTGRVAEKRIEGQVRVRLEDEGAFGNLPDRASFELRAELVEDRADRRRLRLHLRLQGVRNLQLARFDAGEQRARGAAQQHRDLIPDEPALEFSEALRVSHVSLIRPADVIGIEVQEPVAPLAMEADALEEQTAAEVAIPLVARGIAIDVRAADPEIERAGPGKHRRWRRRAGGRRGLRACSQRDHRKRCRDDCRGDAHDDDPHLTNRCPLGWFEP